MTTRRNKEFEAAVAYVRATYAHLFAPVLRDIRLEKLGRDVHGECRVERDYIVIRIAPKRASAAEFVDTLVHELTHLQEHVDGTWDTAGETPAINAGYAAMRQAFKVWPDGWAYSK